MAFDFPSSPTNGQEFVSGGITYVYNGYGWAAKGGAASNYVAKSGDTMTGDLTISAANGSLVLRKDNVANVNQIYGQLNTVPQWLLRLGDATLGDVNLYRFDDAGNLVGTSFNISRANGNMLFEGDLKITKTSPSFTLNKPTASGGLSLIGTMNGANRWSINLGNDTAESGSNVGSNFGIGRFNDAGTLINEPMTIVRSTGLATFANGVNITGALNASGAIVSNSGGMRSDNFIMSAVSTTDGLYYFGLNALNYIQWTAGAFHFSPTPVRMPATTVSTSPATGALTVAGGLGVGGSISVGVHSTSQAALLRLGYQNSSTGAAVETRSLDSGTSYPVLFENSVGAAVGFISINDTTTSYNTSSDASLKEDLKSFDAGNIIDRTEVYDFAWKSTKERAFGVIAQQAVEVYPLAVTHTEASTEKGAERDEWWGVDYSKYVPVLLQELKALRARVAELENKLTGDK